MEARTISAASATQGEIEVLLLSYCLDYLETGKEGRAVERLPKVLSTVQADVNDGNPEENTASNSNRPKLEPYLLQRMINLLMLYTNSDSRSSGFAW